VGQRYNERGEKKEDMQIIAGETFCTLVLWIGQVVYGKMRFRWALQNLLVRMGERNHSQDHVSWQLVLLLALLTLRCFQSVH